MLLENFADILGLGTPELILILAVLILLFGASKIPQLARSLGSSVKELRKGMREEDDKNSRPNETDRATKQS